MSTTEKILVVIGAALIGAGSGYETYQLQARNHGSLLDGQKIRAGAFTEILHGDHTGMSLNNRLLVDCRYARFGDIATECRLMNGATLEDVMTASWRIHGELAEQSCIPPSARGGN